MNDYYFNAVAKQHAAELRAEAGHARLVKIAKQAAREKRAARREARKLQAVVDGRRGFRQALRTLFAPDVPEVAADEKTAEEPTPAKIR